MSLDVNDKEKNKDIEEFFQQYTTPQVKPAKADYQPFDATSKTHKRIRIIRADGSAVFVSYQLLIRFLLSSPDTLLTMIFSDVVITLEGQNLGQLADHLHDEKIKTITCYNPDTHAQLQPGAACIGNITEQDPREFKADFD